MQTLGFTRSAHRPDHMVLTPDTFIRAPFPGMTDATAIIHIAPAGSAQFTQYTLEMKPGGTLDPSPVQRFVYVLEGGVRLEAPVDQAAEQNDLTSGGFAFQPSGAAHRFVALSAARLAVIEKPYLPVPGLACPEALTAYERSIHPQFFGDDPGVELRTLLPASAAFDFAVNTMTFQPGASLPMVEVHVMEHGLLMLEGGGIYRLGDCWYPVTAGDFIWMAPYCPQWFGAIGKVPAKYLIYKDFNRGPLA